MLVVKCKKCSLDWQISAKASKGKKRNFICPYCVHDEKKKAVNRNLTTNKKNNFSIAV